MFSRPKGETPVSAAELVAFYNAARADLDASAARLFDILQSGKVRIAINQRYPLREAARAHADLEARRTTGTTILVP